MPLDDQRVNRMHQFAEVALEALAVVILMSAAGSLHMRLIAKFGSVVRFRDMLSVALFRDLLKSHRFLFCQSRFRCRRAT